MYLRGYPDGHKNEKAATLHMMRRVDLRRGGGRKYALVSICVRIKMVPTAVSVVRLNLNVDSHDIRFVSLALRRDGQCPFTPAQADGGQCHPLGSIVYLECSDNMRTTVPCPGRRGEAAGTISILLGHRAPLPLSSSTPHRCSFITHRSRSLPTLHPQHPGPSTSSTAEDGGVTGCGVRAFFRPTI